jgi:hypothetical protein
MYPLVAVIACFGGALTSAMASAPRLALAWVALALISGGIAQRRIALHRQARCSDQR